MKVENNLIELMKFLPENYEQTCYETNTIKGSRVIKNPKELMFFCLLYLSQKYSLIELSSFAKLKGIKLSDVAFMKKLAKCSEWYKQIIKDMLPLVVFQYKKPKGLEDYDLLAVDASNVTQKGKDKKVFRLHYMINICNLSTEECKITTEKVGETLTNFSIKPKYLIIADRAYGSKVSIKHCLDNVGNFIIRLPNKAFNLYDSKDNKISLLSELEKSNETTPIDFIAYILNYDGTKTKLRICGIKKSPEGIAKSSKRIARNEIRKQTVYSDETKSINNYLVVVSCLNEAISASDILEIYSLRWQVELYFKRLKSILDFGDIPNKKEENVISWLNGKMLLSLLLEKFYAEVNFSPYGD